MENEQIDKNVQQNAIVLAAAADIGSRVIASIAGNDIANTINGAPLAREQIGSLIMGTIVNAAKAA